MEMCSSSQDEIIHVNYLSDDIRALYLSDDYSDVTLKVSGESFKAHKVILASRSEYFRALLFGGLKESQQSEIELIVSNVTAFKALLKYIYTGILSVAALREDVILEVLGLSHQYGFQHLERSISDFFTKTLTVENVFIIYDAARLYHLKPLLETCKTFIDQFVPNNLSKTINSFLNLSAEGLKEILERDSFYAPEVEIFDIVKTWAKSNNITDKAQIDDVLSSVRFELMTVDDLCNIVRPSHLVAPETILDALGKQTKIKSSSLKYRGSLNLNVNMADPSLGTQVLQGEMKNALLDGNTMNYDMENGFTRHSINQLGDSIIIKLGSQCIVNHIKMLLWDKDLRSYSYYIEVSIDEKDWVRVVDHSNYFCRSWQKLYFEPRAVNYLKIVGTHNTVNTVFHTVAFEVMYSTEKFQLIDGIIKPTYYNVATTKESASVIEGVCRNRNSLLDGKLDYDWNNGYTCHQIGSGAILVQLGQPYMVDSMSFLLWDRDDRSYSYYVEVSVNRKDWSIIWDKRTEDCQSWQYITFELRPVVFIRIVGTNNTANEVFHLVHIECPSMQWKKESTKKKIQSPETTNTTRRRGITTETDDDK